VLQGLGGKTALVIMWIHLVAAMTWVGGMLFFWMVVKPAFVRSNAQPHGFGSLQNIEDRFRRIRWLSLVVLLATGVYNLIHEGGSARLESSWGGILMVKLLLVAMVVGLTGIHDFFLTSVGRRLWAGSSVTLKDSLDGLILVLGLLIVFIAVYLGGT
jgi:uncharacterized membrane protein